MSSEMIQRMAVIGAGQMGRGIAQVAATAGIEVLLSDASIDLATKGRDSIAAMLGRLVEKGKLTDEARTTTVERIRPVASGADLGACDLAIEAATERFETKIQIFKATDASLKKGAILASNTSSISANRDAVATSTPAPTARHTPSSRGRGQRSHAA